MKRRTMLRRTGVLAAVGLAGCFGNGDGSNDDGSNGSGGDTPTDGPTVVDQSIDTLTSGCGSDDGGAATYSLDEETNQVVVSGTLSTPDPCHEAVLDEVQYDAAADELSVAVAAEPESETEECVQCVGEIEYRAVIGFDGGLPGTTAVTHDGQAIDAPQREPLEIVNSGIELLGSSNSGEESVDDITFDRDANTVTATGTIEGSDSCTTAELGEVAYGLARDEVSVDVVTTQREDCEASAQALVYIDYEVTVEFSDGVPRAASVAHDGQGLASAAHASESAAAAAPPTTEKPQDARGPGTEGEPRD